MTPTEEAAKLARECAKAYSVSDVTIHCLSSAITPVLAKRLAERDEELKRLREAAAWKPSAADHIVTPMLVGWVVSFWCDGGKDWHGKAVWNHHHAADSVVKTEGDCLAQCMTRLANHVARHCRNQEFAALQHKEPNNES